MKAEILALLRENDKYISGQELCRHFGVSRTAVWKTVNRLKKEGYHIEAVQNKGYKLISSPDVLSAYEIKSRLTTRWMGERCVYNENTVSTNADVRELAEEGEKSGLLCVADMQSGGVGRRGRNWESPAGMNLYFSILIKPDIMPQNASKITLVASGSVAKTIREVTGLNAMIKWPNDIVINRKKVCGILTEMSMEGDYIRHIIVGIGINVNQEIFSEEIAAVATSLKNELGRQVLRAELLRRILEQFETDYEMFEKEETLTPFLEEYNERLVNKGSYVKVLDPKGEYCGIAGGIDEEGKLIVFKENGESERVYAGEVSVRGMYGYV